jgi:hypothetical protein
MNIIWGPNRKWVSIDQSGAVAEMLEEHGFSDCKTSPSPGIAKVFVSNRESPPLGPEGDADRLLMQSKPYRERIGSLLWLSRCSCPQITHQVNALARVAHNPGMAHWHASSLLLRYVAGVRDSKLVFHREDQKDPGTFRPLMYTDATWAPTYGTFYDNYRSTTGWVSTLNGTALSWRSRRQSLTAQSSAESEWLAAADATKEAVYLRRLFSDLGLTVSGGIPLLIDNQSTIKQSFNHCDLERSRHIDLRSHFLREQTRLRNVVPVWVATALNVADQFTKMVPLPLFQDLSNRLGIEFT